MTYRVRQLVLVVCVLLLATGCAKKPTEEEELSATESFVALEGIDLTAVLTKEQVADGLHISAEELDDPILFDEGTGVRYTDRAYTVNLDVTVQKLSEERRAFVLSACQGLNAAPNLGDAAFFDTDNRMLYVFSGAYVMNVYVEKENISDTTRLIVSRHFAALVLEALR